MASAIKWLGLVVLLSVLAGCIANGFEARYENFPWQVALVKKNTPDNLEGLVCGGVALDSEWVMTAAHCFFSGGKKLADSNFKVIYGTDNLLGASIRRSVVDKIYLGEGYRYGSNEADIALVKVYPPMGLTSFMQLPSDSYTKGVEFPGYEATVSGWGLTEKNIKSKTLRAVKVRLFNYERCKKNYPGEIGQRMFCAGGAGKSSCVFDSGGPLFLRDVTAVGAVQAGIVIYGSKRCGEKAPGVYTDVWAYMPWIKETRLKNK